MVSTFLCEFSEERVSNASAQSLGGVVQRKVAEKRLDAVISCQAEISDDKKQRMVSHIVPVLIEWVSMERDLLLKGAAQILQVK